MGLCTHFRRISLAIPHLKFIFDLKAKKESRISETFSQSLLRWMFIAREISSALRVRRFDVTSGSGGGPTLTFIGAISAVEGRRRAAFPGVRRRHAACVGVVRWHAACVGVVRR